MNFQSAAPPRLSHREFDAKENFLRPRPPLALSGDLWYAISP